MFSSSYCLQNQVPTILNVINRFSSLCCIQPLLLSDQMATCFNCKTTCVGTCDAEASRCSVIVPLHSPTAACTSLPYPSSSCTPRPMLISHFFRSVTYCFVYLLACLSRSAQKIGQFLGHTYISVCI